MKEEKTEWLCLWPRKNIKTKIGVRLKRKKNKRVKERTNECMRIFPLLLLAPRRTKIYVIDNRYA